LDFRKLRFYNLGGSHTQATIFFGNGYGASVAQGGAAAGRPEEDSYEVAVLVPLEPRGKRWTMTFDTPVTPGAQATLGYQSREDVERVLDEIAALPWRSIRTFPPYTGDFDEEEAVLGEVATELNEEPENLSIEEDRGLSSFGTGTAYMVASSRSGNEWMVVENEDQERELALAMVRQDLEDEPEMFNQSFIEGQIDQEKLRRELRGGALDSQIDYLENLSDEDFWDEYEGEGFAAPEADEEGDRRGPERSELEELAESQVEERLKDPMEYLEDIYGKKEALDQALAIAGIDVDKAAEEAVDADGPAHFLNTYDGQTHTTPRGLVWWRRN